MLDERPPHKNDAEVRTLLEQVRYATFHAYSLKGYDVERLREAQRKLGQAIALCDGKEPDTSDIPEANEEWFKKALVTVAYRWRAPGATAWTYDPEPAWFEQHRHEIEWQALGVQKIGPLLGCGDPGCTDPDCTYGKDG